MTFVEGVPPSKHFRCITQRHVLRSPITQPNIPGEQVAYRQFPRPCPLPRRRGSARLGVDTLFRSRCGETRVQRNAHGGVFQTCRRASIRPYNVHRRCVTTVDTAYKERACVRFFSRAFHLYQPKNVSTLTSSVVSHVPKCTTAAFLRGQRSRAYSLCAERESLGTRLGRRIIPAK